MFLEVVKTYLNYFCSKSCCKESNKVCRFQYGKYFCNQSITAEALKNNISLEQVSCFKQNKALHVYQFESCQ